MGARGLQAGARADRLLEILLGLEIAGIAWLVLNPSSATPDGVVLRISSFLAAHGVHGWASSPSLWEYLANVALFIPLGFLSALRWRAIPLWGWVVIAFSISATLELSQLLFLGGRTASLTDVSSNTVGGFTGALLAHLLMTTWNRWADTRAGKARAASAAASPSC